MKHAYLISTKFGGDHQMFIVFALTPDEALRLYKEGDAMPIRDITRLFVEA